MKYYHELVSLEEIQCDLEEVLGVVDSLTTSCEEIPVNRLQGALYCVLHRLENMEDKFNQRFNALFETVKEDSHEKSKTRNKRKSVRKKAK